MGKDGFKPKRLTIDRKRLPDLEREEIRLIFENLDEPIKNSASRYAMIGGSLFKWLEIPGYETKDIDVASDMYLDGFGIWSSRRAAPHSTKSKLGHYLVNDVPIDWMVEGRAGSRDLFQAAVETSYLHDGIWCATLEYALAIKLYAGRDKDKEIYNEFVDADMVNDQLVRDIIKTHTFTLEI